MIKKKQISGVLSFEVLGSGEQKILLLHGIGRSGQHWLDFSRELAQRHTVYAVDNRGVGRSSTLPLGRFMQVHDFARDVVQLIKSEELSEVHLVGASFGGMIALEVARQVPDRVGSVLLFNSSIQQGSNFFNRLSFLGLCALLLSGAVPPLMPYVMTRILLSPGVDQKRREWVQAEMSRLEKDAPVPTDVVIKQLVAALRFSSTPFAQLEKFPPLIIVYGREDRFVSPSNSFGLERVFRSFGAKLHSMEGVGHEPYLEKGSECVEMISAHIASSRGTVKESG